MSITRMSPAELVTATSEAVAAGKHVLIAFDGDRLLQAEEPIPMTHVMINAPREQLAD